ncbi:MAG: NAD(P)-dependent oxidoreductase [Pirellulaceae bacterium]
MNQQANTQGQPPVVAITGCSGLIGTRLVKELAPHYRLVGFDVATPDFDVADFGGSTFEFIECDLTDDVKVAEAVEQLREKCGGKLASLVHLAAYYDFSGEESPLYDALTVEGTRRLLRSLNEQDLELEQFIFSSSLLVMESAETGGTVDEDSPVEAEWRYPQSKLSAEKVIRQEHGEIPAVVLRIAGAYDEDCNSLPISQQIRRIYKKEMESRFFPGDKDHGQSFLHLDDLASCVAQTIERRERLEPYEVFLIGEEDVMSYEELQEQIGEVLHGEAWPTIRIPKAVAKSGAWAKEKMASSEEGKPFIKPWMVDLADQNYPVSLKRARERLEWEPEHTLRETLPVMLQRLQDDPRRWYEINGLPLPDNEELVSADRSSHA